MKREYPKQPIVGVGGVVVRGRSVLLVQRGRPPLKGEWTLPGGVLEVGESLKEGVRREIKEETNLEVEPQEALGVFDRIERNATRVRYHYVIIDYVCRRRSGRVRAGSDVLDARWVKRQDLSHYSLTSKAEAAIAEAFEIVAKREKSRRAKQARVNRRTQAPAL